MAMLVRKTFTADVEQMQQWRRRMTDHLQSLAA